jgi:hypothetical protein
MSGLRLLRGLLVLKDQMTETNIVINIPLRNSIALTPRAMIPMARRSLYSQHVQLRRDPNWRIGVRTYVQFINRSRSSVKPVKPIQKETKPDWKKEGF